MMNQETRQRFDELLPWYVNGTLDEDGRRWIECQLEAHPECRGELTWTESLQTRMRESKPAFADGQGFDKLIARIRHGEEHSMVHKTSPERRGARAKLTDWLAGIGLTPALAGAAAVVAVQFGVIALLVNQQGELESEFDRFRSVNTGEVVTGPALEVVFKSDALEREIRETLVRNGGTLAGGPGQLGIYLVYVPENEIDVAKAMLEGNPIVEVVTVSRASRAHGASGG